jgi:hypothetical protein
MRLDADIIEWLRKDGPGYQTKANTLLRREMIRSYEERKRPEQADRTEAKSNKTKRAQSH